MGDYDYDRYYREKAAVFASFGETPAEYIARRGLKIEPSKEWPLPEITVKSASDPTKAPTEDVVMKSPLNLSPVLPEPVDDRAKIVAPAVEPVREVSAPPRDPSPEIIESPPPARLKNLPPKAENRSKRKAVVEEPANVPKNAAASPLNDSIEEISACELPKRPPVNPRTTRKLASAKGKSPLKLIRPLLLSKTAVTDEDLPGSPIEDASGFPPTPVAGPSNLTFNKMSEKDRRFVEQRRAVIANIKLPHKPKPDDDEGNKSSIIHVSSSSSSRAGSPAPKKRKLSPPEEKEKKKAASSATTQPGTATKNTTKSAARPAAKKPKKRPFLPLSPAEYAQKLIDEAASKGPPGGVKEKDKPLKGMTIFYYGYEANYVNEQTQVRMEEMIKCGATLSPTYNRQTATHVVVSRLAKDTTGNADTVNLRRALGIKKWNELPDHVPVIFWEWVRKVIGGEKNPPYWDDCAIFDRFDACAPKANTKAMELRKKLKRRRQEVVPDSEDESPPRRRSRSDPPSPPGSPPAASSSRTAMEEAEDVLAPFYEKAMAIEERRFLEREYDDESDVSDPEDMPVRYAKGFACDNAGQAEEACPNQDVIDMLNELAEIHQTKPGKEEPFRVNGYRKAIRSLRSYPKRISSEEEAMKLPGIGDKTAQKIMEFIETGQLRRIRYERSSPEYGALTAFFGVYGVGSSTAHRWIANGCRTLDDLKKRKNGIKLSTVQEIGVRFYDDINSRMPRAEAKALFDLIQPIALKIDPKLFIEIMGSYRRGKADCGDIDIMITRDPSDGRTHSGVLRRLLAALHAKGILTEDLALPEDYDDLEAIYRGLCRLPKVEGSRRRRIDFLSVPWQSRGAALLYYTGDDVFNRSIRLKARKMGFSLNQRGLYQGVIRDPRDWSKKLHPGTIIASETEEKIFEILKVPYVPPQARIRNPAQPKEAIR